MANGKGNNVIAGLAIFTVSTIAFAFLFGFGFRAGGEGYSQFKGIMPNGNGNDPLAARGYKSFNTRTVFRR